MSMVIEYGAFAYRVGIPVAETHGYRLYLCVQEETARECLLMIAASCEQNEGLDRSAYILRELKRRSDELEAEYAQVRKEPTSILNYELGFPQLLDSFICQQQGGRRINILAFKNVENVQSMVPLAWITQRDKLRVDLRTSVWMMGKLLKLFTLTHSEGIAVERLSDDNILIEPGKHYVVVFDWSAGRTYSSSVPLDVQRHEISCAAQAVVIAAGGNLETGSFPADQTEGIGAYTDYLLHLARGAEHNAKDAHARFYELVDGIWERAFYPFTSHQLHPL